MGFDKTTQNKTNEQAADQSCAAAERKTCDKITMYIRANERVITFNEANE